MYVINGNDVTMPRGDTFISVIEITKDSKAYDPDPTDVIEFSMRRKALLPDDDGYQKQVILRKVLDNETLVLRINANETKNLKIGKYVYNIRLITEDGKVDTFIEGEIELTAEA